MKDKRYYWIKLKTDFFNQETIDFLLSQKNGCQYIVLYQMLCLNTANSNGEMATRIGEMIVPYDVNKIVRDTKHFDFDTVTIALGLFKQLGLIYEEENQVLKIANLEEMVGSEAANANAQRQKRFRERQKQLKLAVTNSNTKNNEDIEYRYKSIDIDNNNNYSSNNKEIYIYEFVEENFGRTISPLEKEKLDSWLEDFDEDVIKYAFEISIMNNKKTFNYVFAILKNWKSSGYKTIKEIKDNEKRKEQKQDETMTLTEEEAQILDYNWFEEEN